MRLSHRTCTACPKLISYSSHSKQCCSYNTPIIKHRRRLHSVYKPQLDDVSTHEHYKSRRDALLSAVVLGAAAIDNEQPAMARVQQQPQCQLDKLQWREHQRTLMHRMTGRRPIVVTLADIQADYDRYASSYNDLDDGAASQALGFPKLRRQLLQQAHGNVLEVAVGTGLNLSLYQWSKLTSLTGIDLSEGMLQEAAVRVQGIPGVSIQEQGQTPETLWRGDENISSSSSSNNSSNSSRSSRGRRSSSAADDVSVNLMQADVARLPFDSDSFDVVLDTFSLCVFPDPGAALAEMARVLRPGGQLLVLEHSRSDNPVLGAYQSVTRSAVTALSKGCDWGQDVPALVAQLPQLQVVHLERHLAGTLVMIAADKQA